MFPIVNVTGGQAAIPVANPDGTLLDFSTAVASLSVLDDWDETNRAAVNIIAGQVGVTGGTGVDSALTQRVTLATNVALPAGTNGIGKLTANSGVDIGDVDVTSISAGDNNIGNVDIVTMPGWSFASIITATTTTVKSGAGVCRTIIVTGGTMGAVTIYDNTAGSGTTIGPAVTPAQGNVLVVDATFGTGLTIVTAAATGLYIAYR